MILDLLWPTPVWRTLICGFTSPRRILSYAEKAVAAAQKAASLNPNLPEVHLSLGSVYNATGKSAEAVSELKKALALAPNSDEAYRRLGDAYRAGGQKPEALAAYQSAVSANPYYWSNHNTLGGAYFEFGDSEKALQEYRKVSELAPDNPIGYQNTGRSLFPDWKVGRLHYRVPEVAEHSARRHHLCRHRNGVLFSKAIRRLDQDV